MHWALMKIRTQNCMDQLQQKKKLTKRLGKCGSARRID
jgi:hypothetical protein